MQRLLLNLTQDTQLTFAQKSRFVLYQAFGHETYLYSGEIEPEKICPITQEFIYPIKKLKWRHIATRKLLNPFKWLDFFISWLLESLYWLGLNFIFTIHTKLATLPVLAKIWNVLSAAILYPILLCVTKLPLGFIQLFLAPARCLIRPTIACYKDHNTQFMTILALTLLITAAFATAFFTGGLSLVVGGLVLSHALPTLIPTLAVIAISTWTCLLKLADSLRQIGPFLYQKLLGTYKPKLETDKIQLEVTSTNKKITTLLHGLNPQHSEIRAEMHQAPGYKFALFTGTEAALYPNDQSSQHKRSHGSGHVEPFPRCVL